MVLIVFYFMCGLKSVLSRQKQKELTWNYPSYHMPKDWTISMKTWTKEGLSKSNSKYITKYNTIKD